MHVLLSERDYSVHVGLVGMMYMAQGPILCMILSFRDISAESSDARSGTSTKLRSGISLLNQLQIDYASATSPRPRLSHIDLIDFFLGFFPCLHITFGPVDMASSVRKLPIC